MDQGTALNSSRSKTIYVTRTGLPLSFELQWPFRHATSGADFEVLHAVVSLEHSGGLRALVAVNLSATLREIFPTLDPKDTEAAVVNALRKEVDNKQIEFVKSGKLVPLPFSSRHYNFKLKQWAFGAAGDEEIERMVERKVFWQTLLEETGMNLDDATESLYLDTTADRLMESAVRLSNRGLVRVERRMATALPALVAQRSRFEGEMANALRQLEEKHAFERG